MSRQINTLKTRAEKLAKTIKTQDLKDDFIEILVFKLGKEKYAIETKYVKEVYLYKDYTVLPNAPPFIFGLVNVRRKVFSIFNLKVFFGLSSEEESHANKLIILEDEEMELAILTDGIQDIQMIPPNEIHPSLPTLTGVKQDFLKGVTSKRIILINTKKLLASPQIIVNETVEI